MAPALSQQAENKNNFYSDKNFSQDDKINTANKLILAFIEKKDAVIFLSFFYVGPATIFWELFNHRLKNDSFFKYIYIVPIAIGINLILDSFQENNCR